MKTIIFLILLITLSCCDLEYHGRKQIYKQRIVDQINQHRENPVKWSDDLETIAKIHSNHMTETGFYSHTWEDGTSLADRFKMVDYSFTYIAENIAHGYSTIESVMEAWMDSECHRKNIVDENFNYVAVEEVNSYWTMVLSK